MDVAITRISSKGQIVIPREMREDLDEGEKMVIIKSDKQLILKRVKDFGKNVEEDLVFAKRVGEALKRYETGEFVRMSKKEFLDKLDQW